MTEVSPRCWILELQTFPLSPIPDTSARAYSSQAETIKLDKQPIRSSAKCAVAACGLPLVYKSRSKPKTIGCLEISSDNISSTVQYSSFSHEYFCIFFFNHGLF